MLNRIIVAIDFDDEAQQIVNYAFRLASKFHSRIWILHVAAPDPEFIGYNVGHQYIRDGRAVELREERKLLQFYADQLKEKGIDCEPVLIQGKTVESILEKSRKVDADLIIMGSHEHSFIYDALVGNTCIEVFKQSNTPVLFLPFNQKSSIE